MPSYQFMQGKHVTKIQYLSGFFVEASTANIILSNEKLSTFLKVRENTRMSTLTILILHRAGRF